MGKDKEKPSGDEFEKNIDKLMLLLKKMMKNQKFDPSDMRMLFNDMMQDSKINLNVFMAFMPVSPEVLDEMDMEFDDVFGEDGDDLQEDFKFELDRQDKDFLKKNGIQF